MTVVSITVLRKYRVDATINKENMLQRIHIGGPRTYMHIGATIITHAKNIPFYTPSAAMEKVADGSGTFRIKETSGASSTGPC